MAADSLGTGERTDHVAEVPEIRVLGVRVHDLDMAAVLDRVREFIQTGKPHMIVTADSSGIVRAQEDEAFRDIVNQADLVTADSSGILIGARWLGTPLKGRVSGVDVAWEMCRMAAAQGFSVYLLGARPGVAEKAADRLRAVFPGLCIAGTRDGYFSEDEEPAIVESIRRSGACVLLVALGIPRQEKWIHAHLDKLGVCVAMGVGGSFDVFSGNVKRAPVWMQRHGLEWAYRLSKDPRKISKVAALPRFIRLVLLEKYCRSRQTP